MRVPLSGFTLAVMVCGSLFAADCDCVTIQLRLCNLLVELERLTEEHGTNTTRLDGQWRSDQGFLRKAGEDQNPLPHHFDRRRHAFYLRA
jgi:hypothetical protein